MVTVNGIETYKIHTQKVSLLVSGIDCLSKDKWWPIIEAATEYRHLKLKRSKCAPEPDVADGKDTLEDKDKEVVEVFCFDSDKES